MTPRTPAIEALVALLPELDAIHEMYFFTDEQLHILPRQIETIIAAAKELAARDETQMKKPAAN